MMAGEKIGADPVGLNATVTHWNGLADAGHDLDFGRGCTRLAT